MDTSNDQPTTKAHPFELLGVATGLLAFFLVTALSRLIAQDEGFYVLAAALVGEGRIPYVEFFYPQMPYLPYLLKTGFVFLGEDWVGARLTSALFGAGSGLPPSGFSRVQLASPERWRARPDPAIERGVLLVSNRGGQASWRGYDLYCHVR